MCVILVVRILYSGLAEWARQNFFKPHLIDNRQSFIVYGIIRYVFILVVFPTTVLSAYFKLSFNGTLLTILLCVVSLQEFIIILLIFHKVQSTKRPAHLSYIEKNSSKEKQSQKHLKDSIELKVVDLTLMNNEQTQASQVPLKTPKQSSNVLDATFEDGFHGMSASPDSLATASLMQGTKEMKRMIFMHMNDQNFFNQDKTRVNSNDFPIDPFDQYIAQGRERSNTSIKKGRRPQLM